MRRSRTDWAPYLLIAPTLLLVLGFIAYPVASVFYLSLRQHNLSKPWGNQFIGLENYKTMFTADPAFFQSLLVTVQWVVVQVGFQLLLGLALALLLNRTFRFRGTARALAFAPWAVSGVLTTQIWLLILNPSTGIGQLLRDVGYTGQFAPLASMTGAFWAVSVAEIWRGVPFFAILILADMQSIPQEMYEAAKVDGASAWQQLRYITLPYLKGAIFLTSLLRAVWEFNNVDLIFTLTGGGPAGATTTLPLYVVDQAVRSREFGYGSALTVVGFGILVLFSLMYWRLMGKGTEGINA